MLKALPARRLGILGLALAIGVAVIVLTVATLVRGDDDPGAQDPPAAASPAPSTETPSAGDPDSATDEPSDDDGADDGEPSPHRPDPPARNLDAELEPLVAAPDVDTATDDDTAQATYCQIQPSNYKEMIYDADTGEVDERLLRDMLVIADELYSDWAFSAYGRPGFESMLTLVYDVNRHWQVALDAYDSGDPEAASDAVSAGEDKLDELDAAIAKANVDCA